MPYGTLKNTRPPVYRLPLMDQASGGVHGDNRLAGNSLLECAQASKL